MNIRDWREINRFIEEYQPESIEIGTRSIYRGFPRTDGNRLIEKDTVLYLKKGDEKAEVITEEVYEQGKLIERAVMLQRTSYEKRPLSATRVN